MAIDPFEGDSNPMFPRGYKTQIENEIITLLSQNEAE